MKSKIEKMKTLIFERPNRLDEHVEPFIVPTQDSMGDIRDKINEIIDYLNPQDQEEYEKRIRIKGELSGETEHIKAHKEYLATSRRDTPEEWEKEFELPDEIEHEDCIEVLADKHKLWEICSWEEPELDPDKVVAFIKQLLEERECRAREEGKREVYEAIVFDKNIPHDVTTFVAANLWKNMRDKAKEELSKLTTK